MKRITLIMAAIVCLAMTAMAQNDNTTLDESTKLAPAQWQHGIAICAQCTAIDKKFAQADEAITDKYSDGYTLEDLNDFYGGKGKWNEIYQKFKQEEGKNGTVADLKNLIDKPQVWQLVVPRLQQFLQDHPESATAAVVPAKGDAQPQQDNGTTSCAAPAEAKKDAACCSSSKWPLWLSIIALLLGLWALLTALSNRNKMKNMHNAFARELDRTNANLQEFSNAAADEMKALSIRMTAKRGEVTPAVATAMEAAQQEPEAYEEATIVEEEELMTLYMAKPNDNGDFAHVSDTFEPGNSIFILNTADGKYGTFEVINDDDVYAFALMMPAENLLRACSGDNIQIPNGKRIITDCPGEAEFINGKWHIVVKADIHYEA